MTRKLVAALGLAMALAACQSTAPAPTDPYLGLLPAGKQVAPAAQTFPVIGAKAKSIGFVLSNSTDQQLAFIEKYVHELKTNPMLVFPPDVEELSKPQYLMTSITNKLKEKFANVRLLQDFNGAASVDYVALVDISLELPHDFVHAFTYRIRVDILTNRLERIGSLNGYGHESYYCMGPTCGAVELFRAQKTAVDQFAASADNALR